jgi:hypothetical protein
MHRLIDEEADELSMTESAVIQLAGVLKRRKLRKQAPPDTDTSKAMLKAGGCPLEELNDATSRK